MEVKHCFMGLKSLMAKALEFRFNHGREAEMTIKCLTCVFDNPPRL